MSNDLSTDVAELRKLLLAERARREQAESALTHFHDLGHVPLLNPNPVMQVSAEGQLLYSNTPAAHLALEMKSTGPSRVRPQLHQAVAQCLRTGETTQQEIAVHDQRYLLFAVPVVASGFAMVYLVDVTARRQAEDAILQQREFYEAILAHLPAVVVVLDPDRRFRYMNAYAEPDVTKRQAWIGRNFADYCALNKLPMALAGRRRRLFERAVSNRELVSWEEQWPRPDGKIALYWLYYYQPIFGADGQLREVMCYGLDITNRRTAEARTRESEAETQAQQAFTEQLLDLNPSIIWVRDAQSRDVFENASARALRTQIQQLAGTATMEQAVGKEVLESAAYADQKVLSTGQPRTMETRLQLASGETHWFQTVRRLLVPPNGSRQVLGVSTDITALKAAQHAAEAAATARENFLANMSHEIRTPLNGVLGMTNLLAKTPLTEQQRNFAAIIQHSGRHLLNVVNDVLDMAKITSGKLELEQAAFNLCDSMGIAAEPLAMQAQEKGIRVVGTMLRESCPLPWIVGDSYRLNQVLINLLSNAIKFTPAGGTITVGGYFVRETQNTLTTEFRVTDTGIGIAPDKMESIFQEFTQAYADTTRQFGGTGLGLSISRALVAQMGGQLTVQSEQGKGSSFSFVTTLPKATPEARRAAQAPTPPVQEATVRGCRVLLVEDNAVNREVAQLLLESHGVVVDEAASGHEALALFAQHRYDAVLMDIQMPGMNGLVATAHIRASADPVRAATPILALTANAFRADAEKYRAAGMNDTLPKPFDEAELLSKLAALINGGEVLAPSLTALAEGPADKAAPPPRKPAAKKVKKTAVPTPAALLFDLALLHKTAHGSVPFMNRILTSFHVNTPESVAALRTAAAAADWPAAAAVAHKLRPSLQLFGAVSLAPVLATLEGHTASETARHTAATELAQGLEALLGNLPLATPA